MSERPNHRASRCRRTRTRSTGWQAVDVHCPEVVRPHNVGPKFARPTYSTISCNCTISHQPNTSNSMMPPHTSSPLTLLVVQTKISNHCRLFSDILNLYSNAGVNRRCRRGVCRAHSRRRQRLICRCRKAEENNNVPKIWHFNYLLRSLSQSSNSILSMNKLQTFQTLCDKLLRSVQCAALDYAKEFAAYRNRRLQMGEYKLLMKRQRACNQQMFSFTGCLHEVSL